ncbi:type I glyceraldehyde-3-phosphate dehydrogenase [Acaryochloris sp. CCMEE 5410]|uniref:type I glyceraldehyde-3-phosphate dehydrogenase n=1 Tax=Acaryochloris sp. CCMEE 5410 TaxID=310037 RepID=UPI0002483BAF|nr:type I glyceraldehyde-3-phosphate dehydrogenase [Acaryochloris sp. CCMEE 5410]KAI9133502.1 type I glyceraldehyde-3-phosphate dehydrogenase [Acaryochloris sp. CCMEE 5410]
MIRVAINGFGRIGRNFMRCWLLRPNSNIEIVGLNDTSDPKTNAHLLTYDSMLGRLDADIKAVDNTIVANGHVIKCVSDRNPANLPWKDWDIDLVIESTGVFVTKEGASKHIEAGAKKVLITAPGKGGVGMYVVGVNHEDYDPSEPILSNASCTTNCLAPVVKILHEQFGIVHGLMTTTHSYTGDQRILDASHRDLRRARAAAVNIVPTSTGAAKAVGTVIPALAGKLNGIALRVPTPNVSVCDFVAQTEKPAIAESVNEVLKQASESSMKGIIAFNEEPLVSGDFKGHDCSSIVDGSLTMGMGGNMIKVVAWYDNEWGYSQRVLDLAEYVAQKW